MMLEQRLFRLLLWLYTSSFRERYEGDMVTAFREARDERGRSPLARTRFAWSIVLDFATTVPRAWWAQLFGPRRRVGPVQRTERQLMQNLIRDIRLAVRGLVRKPGLAITAVTALGLGIGLTTAMFSIVNGVVLRGLPVEEPHEIMAIHRIVSSEGVNRMLTRIHDFRDMRERHTTFEDLADVVMVPVNVSPTDSDP